MEPKPLPESDEQLDRELEEAWAPDPDFIEALGKSAIRHAAWESGRCFERQLGRMADRFAYFGTKQNPNQYQLEDFGGDG